MGNNKVLSFRSSIALWFLCVVAVIVGTLSAAVPTFGASLPVFSNGPKTVVVQHPPRVFTSNTNIRVDADQESTWCSVETMADAVQVDLGVITKFQRSPVVKTGPTTLTVCDLLSGLTTGVHAAGATAAHPIPTGVVMDTSADSLSFGVGASFEWTLTDLSDDTVPLE